jgi:hypothetical protein
MVSTRERTGSNFGKILEGWRAQRFPTARAFTRDQKLSFSYETYVGFERGNGIPNLDQLVEIADSMEQDQRVALLAWLRFQVPTDVLRDFVDHSLKSIPAPAPAPARASGHHASGGAQAVSEPSIENTWVLGPKDAELLVENPWLWDVLTLLTLNYPKPLLFSDLCLPEQISSQKLISHYIKSWISTGYIEATPQALRVSQPHTHLPDTPQSRKIRMENARRALNVLLCEGHDDSTYRRLYYGNLSSEQRSQLIGRLKTIAEEFSVEVCVQNAERQPHALILALGPWGPGCS